MMPFRDPMPARPLDPPLGPRLAAKIRRALRFRKFKRDLSSGAFPLALAVFALAFSLLIVFLDGCSGLVSDERKAQAAEAAFTTEMLRCVDKSETIQESRACRQAAREKWGVDAGSDAR